MGPSDVILLNENGSARCSAKIGSAKITILNVFSNVKDSQPTLQKHRCPFDSLKYLSAPL